MNEVRKIIDAMLRDKITAEDCRKALDELDAMGQAKKDLGKEVEDLKKQITALTEDVLTASDRISIAQSEAAGIVKAAKDKADKLDYDTELLIKAEKDRAAKELAVIENKISEALEAKTVADSEAAASLAKLSAINKELEAAKERFKNLVG